MPTSTSTTWRNKSPVQRKSVVWLKISLAADRDGLDSTSAHLEAAGAVSITIEDAGDHPLFDHVDGSRPVWDNNIVSALFEGSSGSEAIVAQIENAFGDTPLPDYHVEEIPDTDWERSWLERYKPINYGHGLCVCPTWQEPEDENATTVYLDPGLAFGSGTHETTGMCLKWLAEHPPAGSSIIDYGCGSGILAIASLKLGASSATGIDIDPQALTASRANAERNNVSDKLRLFLPDDQPEALKADLIFANILANTLIELKEQLLAMCSDSGTLVLSGILAEQADEIAAAYAQGNRVNRQQDGDWIMMTVEKTTS